MRYVALITGAGEGCDYTIACNKDFEVFEAKSDEDARKWAREYWEENGRDRISMIELYGCGDQIPMPVSEWNREQDERDLDAENKLELERLELRAKELRAQIRRPHS